MTRHMQATPAALHAFEFADNGTREALQRICELAAAHFEVATVAISLLDEQRQWFLLQAGVACGPTWVEESFCTHAAQAHGVMQVADARVDARFAGHPLVCAEDGVRFYAGVALRPAAIGAVGCLCLIDQFPRLLSEQDCALLESLAALATQQLEHAQVNRRLDPVTGLPNKEQFALDMGERLHREAGQQRVLVLIDALDLNWAHDLTLALGISPFEGVARCIGQRLHEQLEGVTRVYHLEVKRFAFILEDDLDGLYPFIQMLVDTLRAPTLIAGLPIRPSVRAGTVHFTLCPEALDDLPRKAMYAAELAQASGLAWARYDPVRDAAYRRAFNLSADIGEALVTGQLFLMFQPRFAIPDGEPVSAEALLRWEHPRLGLISPAEFIPVLEKNALIHEVTRWVLDTGLGTLAQWQGGSLTKLSINLSPQDFDNHDISGVIRRACQLHGIEPARLEVEITEGEWLRSNPQVLAELGAIRGLGVDVAIDDFGTGYSNFSYLHQIPANVLKLDQSLVTHMETNPRYQMIARSILDLSHGLGYRTVAEGVETFKCLQLIRSFGCDEAQGYFLAKPMGEADFISWNRISRFPLRTL